MASLKCNYVTEFGILYSNQSMRCTQFCGKEPSATAHELRCNDHLVIDNRWPQRISEDNMRTPEWKSYWNLAMSDKRIYSDGTKYEIFSIFGRPIGFFPVAFSAMLHDGPARTLLLESAQ